MSADLLRQAAALLRQRAEAALQFPEERWVVDQSEDYGLILGSFMPGDVNDDGSISTSIVASFSYQGDEESRAPAVAFPSVTHIVGLQPAVGILISDLLYMCARVFPEKPEAVAVARAILGGAS